jgi:hypothetical protein
MITIDTRKYPIDSIFGQCNLNGIHVQKDGQFFVFSNETNTIFVPRIILSYDDSIYETGSLELAPSTKDILVHPKIKQKYYHGEDVRVELLVRDKFPKPRFSTTSSYLFNYMLPSSSYYSIVDNLSKNVIIEFSEYTKISHENDTNFFNLNVDFLFPKRSYVVKFKIVNNGVINYYTHNYPFFVFRS